MQGAQDGEVGVASSSRCTRKRMQLFAAAAVFVVIVVVVVDVVIQRQNDASSDLNDAKAKKASDAND